ncbi:MAG TPA: hypothetical protein VLI05_05620 [Candidatus Saccharimonadia bacterium]|nr:hypothetical protein [Candidatus Saccharimonadia bacterium]
MKGAGVAQVDFTLDDIRTLVQTEVKAAVGPLRADVGELRTDVTGLKSDVVHLQTDIAGLKVDVAGLGQEFEDFQGVMVDSFAELSEEMRQGFAEVRAELRGVRRVARQHSVDITELRAAQPA